MSTTAFTIEEVREFVCNNSESLLLSNKYVRAKKKLRFQCNCGREYITTFNSFKYKNKRQCDVCSGSKQPTTKEVKKICKQKGLKPLFKEYKNSRTRMLCETKEGYLVFVTYTSLKQNRKFSVFHTNNKHSIDNVHQYIKNNNIETKCISKEYKGSNSHNLRFRCECGNEFEMAWSDFRIRNKSCPECGIKQRSGKKHYAYNEYLTKEERMERRRLSSSENMRKFREAVFERDNYTCDICSSRSKEGESVTINAHHLNGYHWFKKGRYDASNGVTMCEVCHKKFHSLYGRLDNTKEQYIHFKASSK